MIAGIKKDEVAVKNKGSLANYIASGYPYYTDPMPNLYFTRDPGACVGNGFNIHHMSTAGQAQRSPAATLYVSVIIKISRRRDTRLWYDYDQEYSIEGGDVLVLSKDIVAIGLQPENHSRRN